MNRAGLRLRVEMRHAATLCVALLCCLTCSCAQFREYRHPELVDENWAREMKRRGLDPASVTNPLRYTEEMRLTAKRVTGAGSDLDRLRKLQRHLFNEEAFPYDYESRVTFSAVEAFEARTGNCVSFTNLFISLARSVGLPVRAALVIEPGDVEKEGELIVVNNHIVAVFEHSGGATVFDFNRIRDRRNVGLNIVGDAWITAIYLNNRGAEELFAQRPETALNYLEKAVQLAPDFAAAYGNLGIVRRRLGDVEGAFEAYRMALEIEPRFSTILANLAVLYQSLGREAEAHAALRAADLRGATPYVLIIRGDFELADGRYGEALRLYKQAAQMARSLPEPQLAIARAELARGREDKARKALTRALRIDPDHPLANRMLEDLDGANATTLGG
jgi:Flp pilus assembly protein TadD